MTSRPWHSARIYCGQEGYLSTAELVARTEAGIREYEKAQPLRSRSARITRKERGVLTGFWAYRNTLTKQSTQP